MQKSRDQALVGRPQRSGKSGEKNEVAFGRVAAHAVAQLAPRGNLSLQQDPHCEHGSTKRFANSSAPRAKKRPRRRTGSRRGSGRPANNLAGRHMCAPDPHSFKQEQETAGPNGAYQAGHQILSHMPGTQTCARTSTNGRARTGASAFPRRTPHAHHDAVTTADIRSVLTSQPAAVTTRPAAVAS